MTENNKSIKKLLTKFFNSNTKKIIILKGKWGAGKTYFWNIFFENQSNKTLGMDDDTRKKMSKIYVNYSYVSLFGISNLEGLKSKIFNESNMLVDQPSIWNGAVDLNKIILLILFIGSLYFMKLLFGLSKEYFAFSAICFFLILFWSDTYLTMQGLKKKRSFAKIFTMKFISIKYASKALNNLNKSGIIKKYLGDHTNFIEHNYIRDMVICFDDIERIDSNFSLKLFMGYIDELSRKKNCQIILICNSEELQGQQKKDFDEYREKVVDIEITYAPTLMDLLDLVFDKRLKEYNFINEILNPDLDKNHLFRISNIRILVRIKDIFDDYVKIFINKDINVLIVRGFFVHVVFLYIVILL